MKTSDFNYDLPLEQIAQTPISPRDASRLLVIHRESGLLEHRHFYDLPDYLRPGDALVVNDTRVIPARLLGVREDTGGAMEFVLLHRQSQDVWEVLVKPGRRALPGRWFSFGNGRLRAEILDRTESGGRLVRFHYEGVFETVLDELGQMPLPPYIHEKLEDAERYQTVYAQEQGSAAAPTAGLHFTPALLERLERMGVSLIRVLLHVGLGTFRPVKAENIAEHQMHSEFYQIRPEAAERYNAIRAAGGRIFAVGTTSVRTLETCVDKQGILHPGSGWTQIFIYPDETPGDGTGHRFHGVDALITNFHLPESTLLMLVAAFMGREPMLAAYQVAVQEGYRFFSFGDAMLIL